jgi:TPP-dependent pyruvate/acetoin dehydrogenase alpha subunit
MVSEPTPDLADVSSETLDLLLDEMIRIRAFDDTALAQFKEGDIPGFLHLCHGHEASHAGMGAAMAPDDWLAVGGSRLHGQYLIKGVPMREAMAEIYGKETGPNRGKGGSMHLADYDRHLYGHAATIGSGQNPAAGIALAQQMRETGTAAPHGGRSTRRSYSRPRGTCRSSTSSRTTSSPSPTTLIISR